MVSPQMPSSWSIPTARATRLQALTRGLALGVASRRIHPALHPAGVTASGRGSRVRLAGAPPPVKALQPVTRYRLEDSRAARVDCSATAAHQEM